MPGGRPKKVTDEVVAKARQLRADGKSIAEVADLVGVGKSALAAALQVEERVSVVTREDLARIESVIEEKRERERPVSAPTPPIDHQGSPIDILRGLLQVTLSNIHNLPVDSARLNPARGEARALTRAIATLEKEEAEKETPEEAEARRRQADADTRKRIELYVLQHEADALRRGVCEKCGQPVKVEPPTP